MSYEDLSLALGRGDLLIVSRPSAQKVPDVLERARILESLSGPLKAVTRMREAYALHTINLIDTGVMDTNPFDIPDWKRAAGALPPGGMGDMT